jgi:hypothetical protein
LTPLKEQLDALKSIIPPIHKLDPCVEYTPMEVVPVDDGDSDEDEDSSTSEH